jgi:hypothetical protein
LICGLFLPAVFRLAWFLSPWVIADCQIDQKFTLALLHCYRFPIESVDSLLADCIDPGADRSSQQGLGERTIKPGSGLAKAGLPNSRSICTLPDLIENNKRQIVHVGIKSDRAGRLDRSGSAPCSSLCASLGRLDHGIERPTTDPLCPRASSSSQDQVVGCTSWFPRWASPSSAIEIVDRWIPVRFDRQSSTKPQTASVVERALPLAQRLVFPGMSLSTGDLV